MQKLFLAVVLLLTTIIHTLFAQISAKWVHAGPSLFPVNVSGQINGIGRVCQVKFHSSNEQKVYAVSASGGLWISENGTQTWVQTGTDNLPATACAAVCVDYTNDSIIYISTGDPNYYSDDFGIWKSSDGGKTWNPSNNGIGNKMAVEIWMDPADHNQLVAATTSGVWKSYDGGASWTQKLSGGAFTDMQEKPLSGGRILYACTFDDFYRSTNRGETWSKVSTGLYYPSGTGGGDGMRIAVSRADSNIVYVGMIANRGTIFKSGNGGASFTVVKDDFDQSLVGYSVSEGGQGNYNFDMTCDPLDANVVYVVAHVVWRSNDGGVSWTQLTNWWETVHTDMHDAIFSPYDPYSLYQANDGGVWLSTGAGYDWTPVSNGMGATEIYHAACSPNRKNTVSIGTQDNGELYLNGATWFTNRGGDWTSRMIFDYTASSSTVYYYDDGNGKNILNNTAKWLSLPFTGGFNEMTFVKENPELAFVGKSDVYRTINLSGKPVAWTKISNWNRTVMAIAVSPADANTLYVVTSDKKIHRSDNALSATPTFTSYTAPAFTNMVTKIAVIKNNPNVVYLSCGTKIFRSEDKGANWTDITGSLPSYNIIGLHHDEYTNDESVFIANVSNVYYRNDSLGSWIDFSQGLPSVAPITDLMIYNDGTNQSRLLVSYYGRGVWETPVSIPSHPTSVPIIENHAGTVHIIPNPNNGSFKVSIDGIPENVISIEITDLLGRVIVRETANNLPVHLFELVQLPKGLYLIRLKGKDFSITKSISIQ